MKIAIITGASSGMGREFVKQIGQFYPELDEIWVIARRRERLEELKKEVSMKIKIFEGDLLTPEIYDRLTESLRQENSEEKVDIHMLVNAAGFGKVGKVSEIDCNFQLEMIHLNCIALTHMTKLCIPYMTKGSCIVNIASAAAFCPQPSFSVYAASKSFVLSFSRSLRVELEEKGIVVTAVCPGPVDTEFFDVAGKKEKNGAKDSVMAETAKVVKQALADVKDRKEVSVYGMPMKFCRFATKLIPQKIILKVMKRFW